MPGWFVNGNYSVEPVFAQRNSYLARSVPLTAVSTIVPTAVSLAA